MNETKGKVTMKALMKLIGTRYSREGLLLQVGMSEKRMEVKKQIAIDTLETTCVVEETSVKDGMLELLEGKYTDEKCRDEHDSLYHYVYLNDLKGEWRIKVRVNKSGIITDTKEVCTIRQATSMLKEKLLGTKVDISAVRDELVLEEKGETCLESMEGENSLMDGVDHNCIVYYVPVEGTNGVCITYDANNIVIDVSEFDMSDNC